MRQLPNRIAVTIHERTPVAFAQIGSRISLIDANGVVMGLPLTARRNIPSGDPRHYRHRTFVFAVGGDEIYNRLVSELGATEGEVTASSSTNNYVKQLSEVDLSDPENVKVTANDPGGTMVVHLERRTFCRATNFM